MAKDKKNNKTQTKIIGRSNSEKSWFRHLKKKGKITKILNSEENSKRKVPNQMAKSKVQTHQRGTKDTKGTVKLINRK